MSLPEARTGAERKADVLAKLEARHADLWVASASASGVAHLVPLSLGWDGERVILATEPDALTTKNIAASGRARLALGGTRDVVIIDSVVDSIVPIDDAEPALADAYASQADWDPRSAGGEFLFLLLRPQRVQAWREVNELAGRTLMRGGTWLV